MSKSFKRSDIKKCIGCQKGIAHDNCLTFYRVQIDRLILNPGSLQRAHGLEQFFGGGIQGGVLASVMGTNEDLANTVNDFDECLVCEECAAMKSLSDLVQNLVEQEEEKE